MRKVFLFSVLALACTLCMTGCGDGDDRDATVSLSDITLDPSSLTIFVNGQQQVRATPVPAEATGAFAWTSADESVATVNQSGVVTGRKVGSTSITVSSGNVQKILPVSVVVEEVQLAAISVNRPVIVKAVGDTAQILATAVPPNATGVSFSWSSADERVAKVDQTGIISITGVGATIITVSCGSVSTPIEVEGTVKSITVIDGDGRTGGSYSPGYRLQLTVVIEPADAAVTPEWTTDNENVATVDAGGLVSILKAGVATITAAVGERKNTYTLSTLSPLDEASGYWLFDDPANLGKAVKGEDLVINAAVVTAVAGPSASNGAVRGNWEERGVGDNNVENIRWDHRMKAQIDQTKIRNYTVMMDIKVPYQDPAGTQRQVWAPLSSLDPGKRAALYIAWADYGAGSEQGFGLAASLTGGFAYLLQDKTYQTLNPAAVKGKETWIRFIYEFRYAGDDRRTRCDLYVDGKPAIDPITYYDSDAYWADCELVTGKPVYFMTGVKSDKAYKGQYELSTLAVWDRLLLPDEIAVLGGVLK
jgi:uncharacterized protein YjdB